MNRLSLILLTLLCTRLAAEPLVDLPDHVPSALLREAKLVGPAPSGQKLRLTLPLKYSRSAPAMQDLIRRQQDPSDPEYHKFLTPTAFAEKFGPSTADYEELVSDLNSIGLNKLERHPGRMFVTVEATVAEVEKAFHLELRTFVGRQGRRLRLPISNPKVPARIAAKITGVIGLNNPFKMTFASAPGHGRAGGLTPADIRKAYDLSEVALAGDGETIALAEYDGYLASDIDTYLKTYSLTGARPPKNVPVDGFDGKPASQRGAGECTLDIELTLALAPHAQLLVYEGRPMSPYVNVLSRIATDNLAQVVEMSWGFPEFQTSPIALQAENVVLQQMALQGQTVFIASGDSGAYAGHTSTLHTANPGGQPYATSVGGTKLTLGADGSYSSESSWGNEKNGNGGGGGISGVWPIPAWQKGLATPANLGSTLHRMVPDVSLNAQFNKGYATFIHGQHLSRAGTSASAPLWAAFAALVNQQRVRDGHSRLGFVSPALYQIARSSLYATTFHDIDDGSKNLYYPATPGYDLSTGWGSFKGAALLKALANPLLPPLAPRDLRAKVIDP